MAKIRHLLGISGGKDSAALAIYLKDKYPQLDIEYYFCDTGKELKETYRFIDNLQVYLGKEIIKLRAAKGWPGAPFDYYLDMYGGFLPSKRARWCTKNLKLEPFERFVGDDPVISYVGIRGDEERDGYISKKDNIQSIFPFRQNIWSEDVVGKVLANENISLFMELWQKNSPSGELSDTASKIITTRISPSYPLNRKLKDILSINVRQFNRTVFGYLGNTGYALANMKYFPLVDNEDVLKRQDIFEILENSGVGMPGFYKEKEFTVNGETGFYSRSRSGCFFCFFQQKIEWVWLYEQHPQLFREAMEYEKDGFTWKENESLEQLSRPERIRQIKEEHLKMLENDSSKKSGYLIDILEFPEEEGCSICFI